MAEGQADLSELEKEFVRASAEAIDRRQREREAALERQADAERRRADEKEAAAKRYRRLWKITSFASMVAFVAVVGAMAAIRTASQQAAENRERVLQAMKLQPLQHVSDQLDLALLLSIEANRAAPDQPEVLQSLLSTLTTNLELQSLLRGHTDAVRAVAFSPDGKMLASASYDRTIILRDVATGLMLHPPLAGHEGRIYKLAFSPDGKTLASASDDHTVRLWNAKSGEPAGVLSHKDKVYGVAFRNDGKALASGGADGIVTLWNLEKREPESTFAHSETREDQAIGAVYNVAFNPDGTLLASGGADGRIVLWDTQERKQAGEPLMVQREVFSMAFSHDGKTIASGNHEGRVDLWDVEARKRIRTPGRHLRGVYGVAFSPDDTQLATVSEDRRVYIHNLKRLQDKPQHLRGYAGQFLSVDFAADGKLATGTENGMVVLWDLDKHSRIGQTVQPQTATPTRAVFAGDGKTLVSHSRDELEFWSVEKLTSDPLTSDAGQSGVQFSLPAPSGKELVTIGTDNSIKLWNVTTRHPIAALVRPGVETIQSAALSADGRTLAVAMMTSQEHGEIRLLSMPDGKIKTTIRPSSPPSDAILALAFSPDGKLLAAAGWDSGITVWNVDTAEPVKSLDQANVYSLAFSPKGKVLASAGKDSVVRLWDMENDSDFRLESHRGPVMSVAFSPDGKLLASGSADRTVLLWDVGTRQRISAPLEGHGDAVGSVTFSPDGRWLASGAEDGSIILWEMSIPTWSSRACDVAGRNFTAAEWKQFFGNREFRVTCPRATIDDADVRVLSGDRAGAALLFSEALRAARQAREPEINNRLCWLGSIDGFATMVKPACEQAVELALEGLKDLYRDSRGLDRALTGDPAGAAEDFTAVVEYLKGQPNAGGYGDAFLQRREGWIAALKNGGNPFDDPSVLNALRTE